MKFTNYVSTLAVVCLASSADALSLQENDTNYYAYDDDEELARRYDREAEREQLY